MAENITIRPGKKYKGIKKQLERLAKQNGRSINNYILFTLQLHILNQKQDENKKPD